MNRSIDKKFPIILFLIFIVVSCGQGSNTQNKAIDSSKVKTYTLTDKTVEFLWREYRYDEELKDSFYMLRINSEYCKTISDPEKAAIGYVGTFIGSDCDWDGEYKEDRSNLKCLILDALNLGYQCSEKHLGFLRKWFRNDHKTLKTLEGENCPTNPYGATVDETFDKIIVTTKGNSISVSFDASGASMRDEDSWSWQETDYFELKEDYLTLVKIDKSEVVHTSWK